MDSTSRYTRTTSPCVGLLPRQQNDPHCRHGICRMCQSSRPIFDTSLAAPTLWPTPCPGRPLWMSVVTQLPSLAPEDIAAAQAADAAEMSCSLEDSSLVLRQFPASASEASPSLWCDVSQHHATPSVHLPAGLLSCDSVFVRIDVVKRPLTPPYCSPYKELERGPKLFVLDCAGKP